MDTTTDLESGPALGFRDGRTTITVHGSDEDDGTPNAQAGWILATQRGRRSPTGTGEPRQHSSPASPASQGRLTPAPTRAQFARKVNATIDKAARMPRDTARDEFKIVIRPRGGLIVGKTKPTDLMRAIARAAGMEPQAFTEDTACPNVAQNIVVVSTPNDARAQRYSTIRSITLGTQVFEVFAYHAAPDNTVKGVIRNISLEDTQEDIRRYIINNYNPTVIDAHRIGSSEAVVVLFQGNKVPMYVKYAGVIIRCTIYKQHREVCKTCGQVGHRKDVCPTPNLNLCFACGKTNPGQNHEEECKPHCKLCGGRHPTGDRHCKNRFKVPFQVKKRQWETKTAAAMEKARPPPPPAPKVRLSRKDAFPELPGANKQRHPSRCASRDRSRSKSRGPVTHDATSWAKVTAAGGGAKQPARPRSSSRGDSRIQTLEKMVRDQQDVIAKLTKQLEEILITGHRTPTTSPWVLGKTPQPASLTPQHLQQSPKPSRAPVIRTSAAQAPHQPPQQHTATPAAQVTTIEEEGEDIEEEADQEDRPPRSPRSVSSLSPPLTPGGVSSAVRLRRLSERVDSIEKRMDKRLDAQNAKIDQLAARLDETNARLDETNARLDRLEQFLYEKLGAPNSSTVNYNPLVSQQSP